MCFFERLIVRLMLIATELAPHPKSIVRVERNLIILKNHIWTPGAKQPIYPTNVDWIKVF